MPYIYLAVGNQTCTVPRSKARHGLPLSSGGLRVARVGLLSQHSPVARRSADHAGDCARLLSSKGYRVGVEPRASFDSPARGLPFLAPRRRPHGSTGWPVLADCAPEICAARAQPRRRQTFPASFHQTAARKDIACARRSSRHCPAPFVSCRTAGWGASETHL